MNNFVNATMSDKPSNQPSPLPSPGVQGEGVTCVPSPQPFAAPNPFVKPIGHAEFERLQREFRERQAESAKHWPKRKKRR